MDNGETGRRIKVQMLQLLQACIRIGCYGFRKGVVSNSLFHAVWNSDLKRVKLTEFDKIRTNFLFV